MADPSLHDRYGLDSRFVGRAAFVLFLVWLSQFLSQLATLFLLVFGSIVVAVLLRAIADPIRRKTPLNAAGAIGVAGLALLAILGLAGWLFGREVVDQATDLVESVPAAWNDLQARILDLPEGRQILQGLTDAISRVDTVVASVRRYAFSIVAGVTSLVLVIVGGIMLSVNPARYRDGLAALTPEPLRSRLREVLNESGRALKRWLLAQLIAMTIIGVLTGLGLWAAGVPFPLALGVFAGLAQFVPIVGPIVSAVPGLLLGASQGLQGFLWAAAVYIGVQQLESNVITPIVQRELASVPMAVTVFAVVGFGILFGPLGVLFATPLTVVGFVFVKGLYLRDWLGEPQRMPGEDEAEGA